ARHRVVEPFRPVVRGHDHRHRREPIHRPSCITGDPFVSSAPLVSVVIPTHNYGRYLGEAVESVRAQGVPDVELLVVDDASTDDTPAVLARLAGPDLRAIRIEAGDVSTARNTGIGAARGRFLAFLDADDRWCPGKLARQLAVM